MNKYAVLLLAFFLLSGSSNAPVGYSNQTITEKPRHIEYQTERLYSVILPEPEPATVVDRPEIISDTLTVNRDSLCLLDNGDVLGSLLGGQEVEVISREESTIEVIHPRWNMNCFIEHIEGNDYGIYKAWQIERVIQWLPLIQRWMPDFTEDNRINEALILAVILKESQGDHKAVSSDGWYSVGLMQIIPRNWGCRAHSAIREPHINIWCGMTILDDAIAQSDLRTGLAAYNCSFVGVANNQCGTQGGLNYADDILSNLVPIFEELLNDKGDTN